jgi:hypothetical protein
MEDVEEFACSTRKMRVLDWIVRIFVLRKENIPADGWVDG